LGEEQHIVKHLDDVTAVPCPCGMSRRIITKNDSNVAGLHVTQIRDAAVHYHKQTTELYYVLEGRGTMLLDGDEVTVRPGTTIMIPPGCRHAGRGRFKAVIVTVPPFEADDEYVD